MLSFVFGLYTYSAMCNLYVFSSSVSRTTSTQASNNYYKDEAYSLKIRPSDQWQKWYKSWFICIRLIKLAKVVNLPLLQTASKL